MKRKDVKVTTIELDQRDQDCIKAIQEYVVREEDPIYTVSRRAAISWALRRVAEDIHNGENVSKLDSRSGN